MAKITAKTQATGPDQIKIEGRLDDAALLTLGVVMRLGQQIRATMAGMGVTNLEPEGEEPNDFALAMVHMQRAVTQREQPPEKTELKDIEDGEPTKH